MRLPDDIMDHEVPGRERRVGIEPGLEKGREEGRRLFLHLLTKRFGKLPSWAAKRDSAMTLAEMDRLSPRLFQATTLKDLLK